MEGKEEGDKAETTSAIHQKEFKEKGKHSFPYINSMKHKLSAYMNCYLKFL